MQDALKIHVENLVRRKFPIAGNGGPAKSIVAALIYWAFESEDNLTIQDALETLKQCNCSAAHAPDGLVYDHEITQKYGEWWRDINDAMFAHNLETGERFAPESTSELVWFAVEWYANEMAALMGSLEEMNDPSEEELHGRFDNEILPLVQERDGARDMPARRMAFNQWTDALCKGNEISDWLYTQIDQPASCK